MEEDLFLPIWEQPFSRAAFESRHSKYASRKEGLSLEGACGSQYLPDWVINGEIHKYFSLKGTDGGGAALAAASRENMTRNEVDAANSFLQRTSLPAPYCLKGIKTRNQSEMGRPFSSSGFSPLAWASIGLINPSCEYVRSPITLSCCNR